MNNHDI